MLNPSLGVSIDMINRALQSIDAKINTLESEGKCSPSSGKSTKRASQFDLKLKRDKNKVKFESVSAGIPNISHTSVSANSADRKNNKRILNADAE